MPCNQAISNQIITIYQTQQPNILTVYQTQMTLNTPSGDYENTKLFLRRFYLANMFLTLLTLITIFHAANVTTRCLLLLPVSNGTAITTTNPSLLLYVQDDPSAIMTATHATSLFLLRDKDNSEIMTPSLLLPFNQDNSAIMTATYANLLLPLIRTTQQL